MAIVQFFARRIRYALIEFPEKQFVSVSRPRFGESGRERLERQGHNEGNYAGTILGARGIRRICNPGILIKTIANEEER